VNDNWVVLQGVAEALLQVETLDGDLIHKAFEKAKEGMSSADITAWILSETKTVEEMIPTITAKPLEEPRKRTEPQAQPKGPLDPRPADS
jgi:penicillin V acylase-like amidase (Ntn superfamily)